MKLLALFKYVLRSVSYGVLFAVILLISVPELRTQLASSAFLNRSVEQAKPLSYATAVNVAGPAVVNIYTSDIEKNPRYGRNARQTTKLGSGVIMDASGFLLTNYHVVQNADEIHVVLQDGRQFAAELIGFDGSTDLAVLKVNAVNLPVIPQSADQRSVAGDVVLAIGNPFNLGQTVTQGIISATGRVSLSSTNYLEFLQMDAAINDGNSGGALIDTNGTLVGINSRKFLNPQKDIQGIFFAVPYQLAYKILRKIIAHGRVIRGWLGITANTYSTEIKGFYIDQVTPASPAYVAGLQQGDIVFQIGETPISSIEQALDIVAETSPGTTLQFKIHRQNKTLEVPVTIVEKK